MLLTTNINKQDTWGTAVRYESPKGKKWFNAKTGRKIYIEPVALNYIQVLNGYDQHQVCKGIEDLARVPAPMDGLVNQQNPAFFKGKQASATVFNFLIKYSVTSELIIVSRVNLDSVVTGQKAGGIGETHSLYSINKVNAELTFSASSNFNDVRELEAAWDVGPAITKVKTEHAAVNGMLNPLRKAAWLMGVHAESAYPADQIDKYTLFHNPSEGGWADFFESVKDNLGVTTPLAEHLAAVLLDVQQSGDAVNWVVHSQGGIIFTQAVAHHLKRYPNARLDKNTVAFHAGGNNKKKTDKLLRRAGISKAAPDNDNPFDMVPNLAGHNDMGLSAVKRSLQFAGKVMGGDDDSATESPHTLPFISLEAYRGFLLMAKDYKSAERVQEYMNKQTTK